jgi:TRAP-type C4-dicarboxylate transport system permease small subunit
MARPSLHTSDRLRAGAFRLLFDNFEELIAVGLLCIIGLAMLLQVCLRTLFAAPLSWPEELSQFLFVWASAFGTIGAAKRSSLVRVESIAERLPSLAQTTLKYFILIVIIVLLGVLGWQGQRLGARTSFTAASLPITWAWAYNAAPVFCGLMIIRLLQLQIFRYPFVFIEKAFKHANPGVPRSGLLS